MRFGAIKLENGKYAIVKCYPYSHSTYGIRNRLKEMGATWNHDMQRWENIDGNDLKTVGASRRMKIRVASHCHMPEEDTYYFEHEIVNDEVRAGCPMCDSFGGRAKVLKIYGEE